LTPFHFTWEGVLVAPTTTTPHTWRYTMTQTATLTRPTRDAGFTCPPLPRNRPLGIRKTAAVRELLRAKSGRTDLSVFQPTGNENVRLMADVLAYAAWEEAVTTPGRPSRFNMAHWVAGEVVKRGDGTPPPLDCGTSACLAGTAAVFTMKPGDIIRHGFLFPRGGASVHVGEVGQRELGLTRLQSDLLFYLTSSSVDEIKLIASFIVGRDLTGLVAA
jgi:hypothetical protein